MLWYSNGTDKNYVHMIQNMFVKFCYKIAFDCRVINFQILMTKYLSYQYSQIREVDHVKSHPIEKCEHYIYTKKEKGLKTYGL